MLRIPDRAATNTEMLAIVVEKIDRWTPIRDDAPRGSKRRQVANEKLRECRTEKRELEKRLARGLR